MRVSELSRRSGAPLSTIKFYIREGLLPPGERTGPNQARYGEEHLQRIELIRALREVCGLGTEVVRRVLAAMDDPDPRSEPIRMAIRAMQPEPPERGPEERAAYEAALREVSQFLDGVAWTRPGEHGEFAEGLAQALLDLRRLVDPDLPVEVLTPYAQAAWALASAELDTPARGEVIRPKPGDPLAFPVRMAILGVLLAQPILLTLRRYALFARGSRQYSGEPIPPVEPILPVTDPVRRS